jgi:quercetin dioxygenase-like cupin family protein
VTSGVSETHVPSGSIFLDQKEIAVKCFVLRTFASGLMLLIASSTVSPQQGNQTQRIPQFENDDVKVWRSVVMPNTPLAMHRHEHGRVIIALTGGTMKIAEQNGASETHDWETGKAYWLPKNAPGEMHSDVNAGDKPIEVMVVELKHDR